MAMNIKVIDDLSKVDASKLVEESEAEGYRFLRRLVDQYDDGTNTFNKAGEVLYGVWNPVGELVAIGGLNRDPYSDKSGIGRLRRFYISEHARRQGVGTKLLKEILNSRKDHFNEIVVRTDSSIADAFYRANGFSGDLGMPDATHQITFDSDYSKEAN